MKSYTKSFFMMMLCLGSVVYSINAAAKKPLNNDLSDKSASETFEKMEGLFEILQHLKKSHINGIPLSDDDFFKYVPDNVDKPISDIFLDLGLGQTVKFYTNAEIEALRNSHSETNKKSVLSTFSGHVGIIKIGYVNHTTVKEIKDAYDYLKNTLGKVEGLVIDLRRNSGGPVKGVADTTSVFMGEQILFSTKTKSYSGNKIYYSRKGQHVPDMPLVVLIDSETVGGGELLAEALRRYKKAVLIGITKTAGYGYITTSMPVTKAGGWIEFPGGEIFLPDSTPLNGTGVKPDVLISSNITSNEDAVLSKGFEVLKKMR